MKSYLPIVLALVIVTGARGYEGDVARAGDRAPGFAATNTDGASVSLDAFKGKVVLLDFFATWCGPCMAEMPFIEKDVWSKHRGDGLVVIGIGREHALKELADFKAAKHFTFTIVADPRRQIYSRYASQYIPRCYVVGKDGVIKFASVGFDENEFAKMKSVIAAELKR